MNRKNAKPKDTMWIYGKHAVKAAILNEKREKIRLIGLASCKDFLSEITNSRKELYVEIVDKDYFAAIFGKNATHQGCALLTRECNHCSIEDLIEDESDNRPIIFLDRVTDPQNIGSILRASAVFGARAIVLTEHYSPEVTPAIAKSASGALEKIPVIRIVNLVHSINFLKKHNFWIVGLDENSSQEIGEIDLNGKFVFIIGSEGEGMRRLTRESCDFLVKLPSVDSFSTLNAAQAATISLYESLSKRTRNVTI